MTAKNKHFIMRKKWDGWHVIKFVDGTESEEGPMTWRESDERARILIQAGYDKEQFR